MLKVIPSDRPDIDNVYAELVSLAADANVDLTSSVLVFIFRLHFIFFMLGRVLWPIVCGYCGWRHNSKLQERRILDCCNIQDLALDDNN